MATHTHARSVNATLTGSTPDTAKITGYDKVRVINRDPSEWLWIDPTGAANPTPGADGTIPVGPLGFFGPPDTPGDIELEWAWNASEVGGTFTVAGSDSGVEVVPSASQEVGKLVGVTLASDIPVIPGAFLSVTADRTGEAGDTAVYTGTFAFFALVAQRAS